MIIKFTKKYGPTILLVCAVIGVVAYFFPKDSGSETVSVSGTNNIIQKSETGDNTIINNPPLPEPWLTNKLISSNIKSDGIYRTTFLIQVLSSLPIQSGTGVLFPSAYCRLNGQGGGPLIDGDTTLFQVTYTAICDTPVARPPEDFLFSLNE
jgi:hypothetical protein